MENPEIYDESAELLLSLTAEVVAAYVGNNSIRASELPLLISEVHSAFKSNVVREEAPVVVEKPKPAVNPKKSVHDDYIICLEDGKKFKSLKRHLMTHYSMSPEQYREKWDLDPNYPMVAPNYAAARSRLAKKMGLGRKPKDA
ncbi:MucR family transcriptional regulator [Brucella pseudogrignonensis]|uniref:Transcriptional regulator n=1 Tax=Brucella pseudogrignonensis TaxID=419475 RepID=A0ABU1M652_9HYPH|nr:MucR family transcriptional regulator [Brucella pseudogrignonensis]MDR6431504.1 putative transcriptional regulator [Brucella pseudogrignonensis]MDT6940361.1 MucR family transcriptional regulator [Brucella pseudogrignonensis]